MATEEGLCVTSSLTNLGDIAEYVAGRASAAGLDEERTFEVQMAVDEACTNSIQHAYRGHASGELRVCCFREGDDFVVEITDHGAPFDPQTIPNPDVTGPLEERAIGGLGVYLMRRLMDSVHFRTDPESGNVVVMRKSTRADRA
jgi:anti-sigma regulatory factor (Ser/Thr protein kinase)